MNKGVGLAPYVVENYPLNFDKCKLPGPYFSLEEYEAKIIEDITLN